MGSASPEPDDAAAAEPVELVELRKRVERLEQPPSRTGPGRRLQSLLAAVLILLAFLLTPLGVLSVWVNSQVTDTDRYVATVAPLARNPAVQAAVTDRATTAIMGYLPISSLLDQVAPTDRPLLSSLLGTVGSAVTDGLTGFVHTQVASVVGSDSFAALWTQANRAAHAAVDKALTGEGGGAVQIQGNTVTLDLAPLIDQAKSRLVAGGLSVAGRIPTIHTSFVLTESSAVGKARTYLRVLQLAGDWLPVAAVLCAAAGVLLSVRRRRALVTAALAMAVGAGLLTVGLTVFRALYLDKLPSTVDQAAAGAVYDALVHFLRGTVRAVVALGVLTALGGWVTGPGRHAMQVRSLWRAGFGAVRQTAQQLGLRLGPLGRFVHRFKLWLCWAALAVVVGLFLTWSYPTDLVVFWLGVGLLAALGVLEFLDDPGGLGRRPGQPPSLGTIPAR
ncbi:hypothetical protein P3T37_004833 [Kitasatospora sp. MAA4]|uniref:hypothetical protein n=1 Tax=Kitasatospora sp. MAA4 TaxID=3035093 RepID=UPI002475AA9C|nr:hypothetical protein [Kitasatospora sp. MAA4]MDH6135418.1 hypothetical protein [Kitasatospora sp. MAA4]